WRSPSPVPSLRSMTRPRNSRRSDSGRGRPCHPRRTVLIQVSQFEGVRMRGVVGLGVALAMMAGAADAKTVAVTAERLLDVKAGRYIDRPMVVITDGRIASV